MKWNVTLLAGALLLLGADLKATTTFSELEADMYLSCGGSGLCGANDMSMGDFDGDGFDDLIYDSNYSGVPNFVVFGDNFPAGGGFPSFRTTRVGSGISEPSDIWQIGDITGDRRADLFHFRMGGGALSDVTLGRPNPPAVISSPVDFAIDGSALYSSHVSFGDVNGDGVKDLLSDGVGAVYVVFGSTSFGTFTSTITLTDPAHVMKILGGVTFFGSASGDVDGDGLDEIIFADTKYVYGTRTQPGVVYVIRGSTSLPSTWDLGARSADWTISGEGVEILIPAFAADFTGDGKADLGLEKNGKPVLLSGADIISKGSVCTLTPGHANSLTPTSFPIIGDSSAWILPGDFDGDSRPDLCVRRYFDHILFPGKGEISLFLSHSFPEGTPLPEVFAPADIRFTDLTEYDLGATMGDLNGDKKSDLIYTSWAFPRLNVFYGYRPLENPSIVVQSRESNQARVHLTLGVEGEPAEMKLTGGILDPPPGMWIPFQEKVDVTLTPAAEEKTITAVFRTSGKRESGSVSATIPLVVGEPGDSVVTNLLRDGGTARFESRMDTAGRLTAAVYSREGEVLRNLIDEEMSSGVHVIEWDGKNAAGEAVSPGMYMLVVTVNGHSEIHKIIVQG